MRLKSLRSKWTLAVALMLSLLRSLLFIRKWGAGRWLRRLSEESLAPTAEAAWTYIDETSRCLGCGLCDAVAGDDDHPSAWILARARAPGDAPLAADEAARLRELSTEIAAVCPARLSADAIGRLIEDNNAALAQSSARR